MSLPGSEDGTQWTTEASNHPCPVRATEFDPLNQIVPAVLDGPSQMLEHAQGDTDVRDALCKLCGHSPEKLPSPVSLGMKLRSVMGYVVGQQKLTSRRISGKLVWSLIELRS